MSDQEIQIKRLAEDLTSLTEFVPTSKDELDKWYVQARSLEADHLLAPGGLSQYMPYFLWHYLSDADIRMKDEVYAEMQNRQLNILLEYLKQGVIPSDEDLGIIPFRGCLSLITRWFGWRETPR